MSERKARAALWLALSAAVSGSARAQQTPPEMPAVVVVGQRASLDTARQIRRNAEGIVDAVVADDIDKLPDFSVNDALQRVPGVQIGRDRGEGTAVAIRGLTQMETTINGREVFTAGTGRTVDFADLPADMVAAISVYKTAAADQLEGGVGGLIDLRTRRPFDFPGRVLAATAREVYGDLIGGSAPQFSVLGSQRWPLGGGQFGALVSLSSQRRAWREDQKSTAEPRLRTDLAPGQAVLTPNGDTETASIGRRRREAAGVVLQWRPQPGLELYAEGTYAQFKTLQDSYQINVAASPTFLAGSAAVFPGTRYLERVTWTNAPLSMLSFARDTVDRNRQLAVGGSWRTGDLALRADLSRSTSFNYLFFSGPTVAATAVQFSQDFGGNGIPATSAAFDAGNPASYRYTGMAYRLRPFEGALNAARLDAEWARPGNFLHTVSAGIRLAHRDADNGNGTVFADAPANVPGAALPGALVSNPAGSLFPGEGASNLDGLMFGNLALARDPLALRRLLGITAAVPASANPLTLWSLSERSTAGWLMGSFRVSSLAIDGNAGVRVVHNRAEAAGFRSVSGGTGPIASGSSDTDWLPSANLRYRSDDNSAWRAAASKTITRPNFDQLSPSLTLIPNSINPAANTGSAGNPALAPVRSNNLDLAWERYLPGQGMLVATLFWKHVDGFITNLSAPETIDGVVYQINRPRNANPARIKGAELAYQQFFSWLPGAWGGLGTQLNFTWVDSRTPSTVLGSEVPLQNLSRQSANAVLLYDYAKWSARVAYNWRSRFLGSVSNFVGIGAVPVYTRGYGWLDASLRYKVNEQWSLALEGNNLLRTVRRAYYGAPERHQSSWLNDRQIVLSASMRY
jgi:iron complex outermembrane receptor protein